MKIAYLLRDLLARGLFKHAASLVGDLFVCAALLGRIDLSLTKFLLSCVESLMRLA